MKCQNEWSLGATPWLKTRGVESLPASPREWLSGKQLYREEWWVGCGQKRREERTPFARCKASVAWWFNQHFSPVGTEISPSPASSSGSCGTLAIRVFFPSTFPVSSQPWPREQRKSVTLRATDILTGHGDHKNKELCLWFGMSFQLRGCVSSWVCRSLLVAQEGWITNPVMCF